MEAALKSVSKVTRYNLSESKAVTSRFLGNFTRCRGYGSMWFRMLLRYSRFCSRRLGDNFIERLLSDTLKLALWL